MAGTMAELQRIVSLLNYTGIETELTLSVFDEKSPAELLGVLNSVFKSLSPSDHSVDLMEELPEDTQFRMVKFLGLLKFPTPSDPQFANKLIAGETTTLHAVLQWLLERFEPLKRRAYLAPFLTDVEVPPEIQADETVKEVMESLSELKAEFITVHKQEDELTKTTNASSNLKSVRENIKHNEDERRMLKETVAKVKKKMQKQPNFEEVIMACKQLRKEMDRGQTLARQAHEQPQVAARREQELNEIRMLLEDMNRMPVQQQSAQEILGNLEREVNEKRHLVYDRIPRDLQMMRGRLENVTRLLHGPPVSNNDIADMQYHVTRLNNEIAGLMKEKEKPAAGGADPSAMIRQQAKLIQKKKAEVMQKRDNLLADKQDMEQELGEKGGGSSPAKPKVRVLKGEEYKKFAANMRQKSTTYRRMKAEWQELREELGRLQRSEQILEKRDATLSDELRGKERAAGVEGHTGVMDSMRMASEAKAKSDVVVGLTLEQNSEMIATLKDQVNERKAELQPRINELKALRAEHGAALKQHKPAKEAYDKIKNRADLGASDLQEDLARLRTEMEQKESLFHQKNVLAQATSVASQRTEAEVGYRTGSGGLSEEYRSYRDLFGATVQTRQLLNNELREAQSHVKNSHEPNLKQLKMFKDLRKLLECKLRVSRAAQEEGALVGETYHDQDAGEVNRLEIED